MKTSREFYINKPFYSAGQKFGWENEEYGVGLEKNRIDHLAHCHKTAIVRIGNEPNAYTIKAREVQRYPVDQIKNYDLWVYVVPKSKLNYKKIEPITTESLFKLGVFG